MAAAAARARVTGTLTKEGAEGAPPLPSSPGSQIFVVGGGASELVVLVVVSGEHGGNSGEGWGPPRPDLGVHATQLLPPVSDQCCLPGETAPASPIRQVLAASPRHTDDPCIQRTLLRMSKQQGRGPAGAGQTEGRVAATQGSESPRADAPSPRRTAGGTRRGEAHRGAGPQWSGVAAPPSRAWRGQPRSSRSTSQSRCPWPPPG